MPDDSRLQRAVLIYNPVAGRRRQRRMLASLLPRLKRAGFRTTTAATDAPGAATALARRAVASGAHAVFVLGGDGTVREAAAALVGGEVPLGILPAGTTNVLAHALELPARAEAAAGALATGHRVRRIDVGRCGDAPFLMMASGGLDAYLLEHLHPGLKARLGKLGVALQGAWTLLRYPYPELELEVDGVPRRAGFFAVSNIPFYGGTFRLCPGARCDDGRLDLVTFSGRGAVRTLAFAVDLLRGRHLDRPDVEVAPVERVVVRGPAGTPVQIDGDPGGAAPPVEIALAAGTLPVLVPSLPPD